MTVQTPLQYNEEPFKTSGRGAGFKVFAVQVCFGFGALMIVLNLARRAHVLFLSAASFLGICGSWGWANLSGDGHGANARSPNVKFIFIKPPLN